MKALKASDFPELQRVFAGYLHEDFLEEHGTPSAALRAFHEDANASERQRFSREARRFLDRTATLDFSDVRIHTDARATDSAKAVQAHAYTVGSNIVFQGDRYSPGTAEGQRTLAHELTHVVQQRSGPVDSTPAGGGISVSDPSDRFEREAEATADRVMSGGKESATATGGPAGSSVQREDAPEEEPVQALSIQRQEAPEEEQEEAPA